MKRTLLLLLPVCLSVFLLSYTTQKEQPPKALLKTLIIDAGHGGIDPGARGNFSTEADVSLSVALKFWQRAGKRISGYENRLYPDYRCNGGK